MAYKIDKDGVLLFTIGGKCRRRKNSTKRVRSRFASFYQEAWKEALAYVKQFDKRDTVVH